MSPTDHHTLSLHDALPIFPNSATVASFTGTNTNLRFYTKTGSGTVNISGSSMTTGNTDDAMVQVKEGNLFIHRSEEHTSELQSRFDLVCRLLLEKKNTYNC